MTQPPLRVRPWLLPAILTALMTLGAGSVSAQSVSPTPLASSAVEGTPTLEDQLAQAQAQVRALTAQNEHLQDLVDAFDTQYDPMEAERQLLLELRKPLPETHDDAQTYLERLQRLANASDPGRLGQPAARVIETASVFLDWRDQSFATQAEADAAFLSSGAAGFGTNFNELKDAILLTVANRLDALLSIRDRIR
jgi:hypothetical protein